MKLDSAHAILDVKRSRRSLQRELEKAGCSGIPVTIHGRLVQVGNDDGTSTEFMVDVTSAECGEACGACGRLVMPGKLRHGECVDCCL